MVMLDDVKEYDEAWEIVSRLKYTMGDLDYSIPLELQTEDIDTIEQDARRILEFVATLRGMEEPYVETTLDGRRIPPAETGIGIEKPE